MSFTTGPAEPDLGRRLEELEVRLEYLEAVVLDDVDEADRPHPADFHAALHRAEAPTSDRSAIADATVTTGAEPAEIVSIDAVPAEVLSSETVSAPAPALTADAPAEPKHLRKLQAAATADVPFTSPIARPEPTHPTLDLRDIEERLAGRALALVGGAALFLGAVFFLSLAFSRGWIGPELQVALGLVGGSLGLAIGGLLLIRGERMVGHVLTAVGLAVISLSLFAATSLYDLAEPALALLGVFLAAAAATLIAVRGNSQVVAGFGLAAVMAAPPVMGAEPDLITVAYMAVALVAIAAVSLWQTWPWLPPLAFILSAPQLLGWIVSEPDPALSVPVLLGYWTVLAVAAGGEAFRRPRHDLSITSAPLFLVLGAVVIGMSFIVLETDDQRAAFLLALATLHGLVTAFFATRRGLLDPFGLLAGAYGLALASAAVPLLLDAPATGVVWTAEAAAIAFLAGRRAHGPALSAAIVLFVVAAAAVAYEAVLLGPLGEVSELGVASGSVEGVAAAFGFLAAAVAVSMMTVPTRAFRTIVSGLVSLVAVPLAVLLLDGAAVVTAWMSIAVLAVGAPSWVRYLPERRIRWRLGRALRWIRPTQDVLPLTTCVPLSAATIATALAFAGTVLLVIDQQQLPPVPFTDAAGLAALSLAGGFVAIGIVIGGPDSLRRALIAAGLTVGLVAITEFAPPWYVLVWVALAVAAAMMSRADAGGILSYRASALGALAMLAVLAVVEAPPDRLVVTRGGVPPHTLLASDATLALGALAIALGVVATIAYRHWPARIVSGLAAMAGLVALYLLSVATVDVFAGEAYGLPARSWDRLDELAKEAQVALSVLWTTVGVVVLGFGLLLRQAELRIAGLAVLGLATVKVFLVDLSSLDVAYRVITLIVLGLLLIVSAYAWSRMKPGDPSGRAGRRGHADAASHDAHARP